MIVFGPLLLVAGVTLLFLTHLGGKRSAATGTPPAAREAILSIIGMSLILWYIALSNAWIYRSGHYGEPYVSVLAAAAFFGNSAIWAGALRDRTRGSERR